MKADTYADYPSKHPLPYWKAKFKQAYNEHGCVMFCEGSSKCKYRNKFDHRVISNTPIFPKIKTPPDERYADIWKMKMR